MLRRRALVFAAVVAACGAFCFATQGKEKERTFYYYMITASDGTMEVTPMASDDAAELKREIKTSYREALKDWVEQKQAWYKAVGKKPFPLPRPRQKKIQKLGRIPSTERGREKALERYQRRLEVWHVCIVKDHKGELSAEAIRRDKVYAKQLELLKEFVTATMEWVENNKDAEDQGDDAPVKPYVKVVKSSLRSSELADKYTEKLAEKLERDAEKQEAQKEQEAK